MARLPASITLPAADTFTAAASTPTTCTYTSNAPPLLSAHVTTGCSASNNAIAGWIARPVPLLSRTAGPNVRPALSLCRR